MNQVRDCVRLKLDATNIFSNCNSNLCQQKIYIQYLIRQQKTWGCIRSYVKKENRSALKNLGVGAFDRKEKTFSDIVWWGVKVVLKIKVKVFGRITCYWWFGSRFIGKECGVMRVGFLNIPSSSSLHLNMLIVGAAPVGIVFYCMIDLIFIQLLRS